MNRQYISEAFDQLGHLSKKHQIFERSEVPYIKTIYSFKQLKDGMGPFKLGKTLLYDYYDPDAYGDWSEQPVKGVNSEEEFLSLFKLRNGGLYLPKGTILDFVGDDYYHDWFSLNDTDKEIGFLSDYDAYD